MVGRHYGPELTHGARVDDAWTYRGVQAVVLENELLRVVVLAGKGADIASLQHKPTDTEFMWRSPWGVRDPAAFVPATGDRSAVWIDCYEGGWQTVVPNAGFPATYRNADWGQHAEANLLPWDADVVADGPDRAAARFRVRLPRSPLMVEKVVSLESGSPTLQVHESVTNVGAEDIDIAYGQHIALGPPFLSADCVVDLPGGTVHSHPERYSDNNRFAPGRATPWPYGELHDGTRVSMREVPGASARFDDQAYITDLPDGWYAVTNTARGVGIAVRWPVEVYPHLWYWQMFGGGIGYPWWGQTYNVGLEPFTSDTNRGLEEALRRGTGRVLAAGETLRVDVRATAYRSRAGVRSVAADGAVDVLDPA